MWEENKLLENRVCLIVIKLPQHLAHSHASSSHSEMHWTNKHTFFRLEKSQKRLKQNQFFYFKILLSLQLIPKSVNGLSTC